MISIGDERPFNVKPDGHSKWISVVSLLNSEISLHMFLINSGCNTLLNNDVCSSAHDHLQLVDGEIPLFVFGTPYHKRLKIPYL